ncbi:MAG: SpvB/TcaC N-terminal domain-containing protein [Anaerolineae bacterium]
MFRQSKAPGDLDTQTWPAQGPAGKPPTRGEPTEAATGDTAASPFAAPTLSLPKGGGAIRGIGEKFAANPVTGTGSLTVPIPTTPGRSGFGPQLSLTYDSGAGNGAFGLGWSLALPAITRKTDKGLPRYNDGEESDVFILSGAEDLVPVLDEAAPFHRAAPREVAVGPVTYRVESYRPRIEGLFARIERWTDVASGMTHWRSISRDNITSLYGQTADSRIADPTEGRRVFAWSLCESYDDRGNVIRYEYARENRRGVDDAQAHERNRRGQPPAAHYLKRILYGNRVSRLVALDQAAREWCFEVVFDYDEGHYAELPDDGGRPAVRAGPAATRDWSVRLDPFSSYRAGFEVRTYRLCRRILMFHHFPDELGAEDYLVRSTEFTYAQSPVASFIERVTQSGYTRRADGSYLRQSLPPLDLAYSQAVVEDQIRDVAAASLENLPAGVDGSRYQWVDLDGEGAAGILTEQAGAWLYKRNLSPLAPTGDGAQGGATARFGPAEVVPSVPAIRNLGGGQQRLLDLGGNGKLDLVHLGALAGFHERTPAGDWEAFVPFGERPTVNWNDPNLRFVDLTGDGLADVLITEHDVFTWHPSRGEDGFGPGESVRQALDEEKGPRLVFADGSQSVYLADMAGDGLLDLVRVANAEVAYWPNLGYGRFGACVTMDDAPWLDQAEWFDQARVRLADIDGSGATDLVYLGRDGVRLYFNQSGNRWSEPTRLPQSPPIESLALVNVVDLFGAGTACLVWSSPLPADQGRPMRYIDLMRDGKPHLLVRVVNNLGAETRLSYASSTHFYLADKQAGQPWRTRLPFPAPVVARVEVFDWISRSRFVTRYAYHHGDFDGYEREFRGFGCVEQWDTEEYRHDDAFPQGEATNWDATSWTPPIRTRTWFHTGAFEAAAVSRQYGHEYWVEPALRPAARQAEREALLLPDTVLPPGLTANEAREACRALKGMALRTEVYAEDGTPRAAHPYTVTEQSFTLRRVQPRAGNRHAVFFAHPSEAIAYDYERVPDDPRVSHTLTLEVDEFGNVLKSAAVGYGRRRPDPALSVADQARQTQTLVTYTESRFTHAIDGDDARRAPLPADTRTYELSGYAPTGLAGRFRSDDFVQPDAAHPPRLAHIFAGEIAYEDTSNAHRQRRLIEHVRTLYRRDDLTALLPLGELGSLALPGESYRLAFTPGLLAAVFQRDGEPLLPNLSDVLGSRGPDGGGYVSSEALRSQALLPANNADPLWTRSDADGHWWIPSGRVFLSPTPDEPAGQELAYARQHFFLPRRFRAPFHTATMSAESSVTYDRHDLLMVEARDALGNRVTVGERRPDGSLDPTRPGADYRVLQPYRLMEPNRNRSMVAFDALGMVVGTAIMGKPEETLGDSLDGFDADLTDAAVLAHIQNPLADPHALLGRATTCQVYDLFAYQRSRGQPNPQPAVVYTLVRETHAADLLPGQQPPVQHSFAYFDGVGRQIQKKIQAEAGPAPRRDADGRLVVGADGQPQMTPAPVSPRWVGSGWTVLNNKGKAVRQYEPFFTDTHRFEADARIGVSATLFYDPAERVVATLHPDHTWEKVVFDPWRQASYDVNDTVLNLDGSTDPKLDADVAGFFARLPDADYLPTWYAARVARAANDPERVAADKAALHRQTPSVAYLDTLGRPFLTLAHNRFERDGAVGEETYPTRVELDIEGNRRAVYDAVVQNGDSHGRVVMRYAYDMLDTPLFQFSMEAGRRWILTDVAGKPIRAWDSRGHRLRAAYDALRRPTDSFVSEGADAETLVERTVYGDSRANPEANNLCGKVVEVRDQAGVVTTDDFDFKGNLLSSRRQFAQSYTTTLNWSAPVALEPETFARRTRYDALNRPIQLIAPHSDWPGARVAVVQPMYNEANLLEQLHVWLDEVAEPANRLDPATATLRPVADIDYNARSQRTLMAYGNGVTTAYEYDPLTFRLRRLLTRRDAAAFPDDCPTPPPAGWPGCQAQNLSYSYDAVGNVTHIRDDAQQTIYFKNKRVEPSADYTYDAVYRLIEATGREHLGQAGGTPVPYSYNDARRVGRIHPGDGNAVGTYVERYLYDAVGNILAMQHRGSDPVNPGWTRTYAYSEASLIEPARRSNRLTSATVGAVTETYSAGGDGYDAHGNMLRLPQLQAMQWDFQDQLRMTRRQAVNADDADGAQHAGERTWYVYDAVGQRARKVTERQNGTRRAERIYLGGFEVYREYDGGGNAVTLERETLHIMDGTRPVAVVETRTRGDEPGRPARLTRYQFGNHLGSASLELDEQAKIISYEEYTPYGSTSYQAVRSQTETPKRYRYTGKERDEETGFTYHGARYYAPWLGRWTSCDPASHINLYSYCEDRPTILHDPDGRQERPREGYQANVTGKESQDEVRKMFAGRDIFYTGEATWVKSGEGGYWHIHDRQVIARDTGRTLNMRADAINSHTPRPAPKPKSTAPSLARIKEKREEDWKVAQKGMWNAAVDIAVPMWLPDSVKERAKFAAPAATGDAVRDYELKESFEGGEIVTHTAVMAVSLVPVGEIAEGAQLAASKLPKPAGGLGMVAQDFVGFSEAWAAEANTVKQPVTIALGRAETPMGSTLEQFARERNAAIYSEWKEAGLTDMSVPKYREDFPSYFHDALRDPSKIDKIHFNLEGVTSVERVMSGVGPAWRNPWGSGLVTRTELLEILRNPALFEKTVFWQGSRQVFPFK